MTWQPLTPGRDVPWLQTSPSGRDRGGCDGQRSPSTRRAGRSSLARSANSLGYAFARQLAVEGLSLLLVDILDEDLHPRAKELRRQFGVDVRTATCDLGAHAPYPECVLSCSDRPPIGSPAANERRAGHYGDDMGSITPHSHLGDQGPRSRGQGRRCGGKCSTGIRDIAAAEECQFGLARSRHRVASPWYVLQAVSVWISFEGQSVSLFESLH